MTGLFNRRAFFEQTERLEAQGASFAILMIDIDHFKSINDNHGHLDGDRVLVHAARLIQSAFWTHDILCCDVRSMCESQQPLR